MTTPVDPSDALNNYVDRMRLLTQKSYGVATRPQLAGTLASSSTDKNDLQRIGAYLNSLDTQNRSRIAAQSGALRDSTPQESDQLDAIGASDEKVVTGKNADSNESHDPESAHHWYSGIVNKAKDVWYYGVYKDSKGNTHVGDTRHGDAYDLSVKIDGSGVHAQTKSENDENPLDKYGNEAMSRFSGFVYREGSDLDGHSSLPDLYKQLTGQGDPSQENADFKNSIMKLKGYDPSDPWDRIAFNWTQGESTFNNLDGVSKVYGKKNTDLALQVFLTTDSGNKQDALFQYQQNLQKKYMNGEIDAATAADQMKALDSKDFAKAYDAVDRQHVSIGRDFAHAVLPKNLEDGGAFTAVSGATDAAWTIMADPTLGAGKVAKTAQEAKLALDSFNDAKIYKLLGATNPETGVKAPVTLANRNLVDSATDFVSMNKAHRDALAAGKEAEAATIYSGAAVKHKDFMPLWDEMSGNRVAITADEVAAANAAKTTLTDVHGVSWPVVKSKPIDTVDDFANYLVHTGAVTRLTAGMSAKGRTLMPGVMGHTAANRANWAMARTARGIARQQEAKGGTSIFDFVKNPEKLIGDEAEDQLSQIADLVNLAKTAGQEQLADRTAQITSARRLRSTIDATSRRLTTLLPDDYELDFYNASHSKKVEQIARTFLPKFESARFASMWAAGTSDTRRQLGFALRAQIGEASGMTRSAIGKKFWDKYLDDTVAANVRRYGFGDTDKIADGYEGARRTALYPAQIDRTMTMPNFTQMKQVAAKASVLNYDPVATSFRSVDNKLKLALTNKRNPDAEAKFNPTQPLSLLRYSLFNSPAASRFTGLTKLGWITTPANAIRNGLDEYLLLTGTGNRARLAEGRALMREAGLARTAVSVFGHKIPVDIRSRLGKLDDVMTGVQTGKLRMAGVSDEDKAIMAELNPETLDAEVGDFLGGRIVDNADERGSLGASFAEEAAKAGVPVERFGYTGHALVNVDGDAGVMALAKNLSHRFHMPKGDWADAWEESPGNGVLAYILARDAAADPAFGEKLSDEAWNKIYEYFPSLNPFVTEKPYLPGPDALEGFLKSDRFAKFRQDAEAFNVDSSGNRLDAGDEAGRELVYQRMAANYLVDVAAAVTGKEGIHPDLASRLVVGDVPDAAALKLYGMDFLPPHAIKATYGPVVGSEGNWIMNGLTKQMVRAYDTVVTKPLKAHLRTPLYTSAYVDARKQTIPFEKYLTEQGWDPVHASDTAQKIARSKAMDNVIRYVDNPRAASQFSAMNRNWWAFERAAEDWARRYGTAVAADPTMIRKGQLAIYGAEQAGILDRDSNGNLIVTYPGSGAVIEGLMHVSQFLGVGDRGAQIPHVDDLQTQLTFLNPSFQNPWGYSSTPLVSIPYRMLASVIPGHELTKADIDRTLNGQLGQGRSWWEQMMPSPVNRLIQLYSGDGESTDTSSAVGGAMATAMMNMAVNGSLEKYGTDDASKQRFITDLQTQTTNALAIRSIFGLFAPGAPTMPTETDDEGFKQADLAYRKAGYESLNTEFRKMTADMGAPKAYALWTELHPEATIFEAGAKTDTLTPHATVGSTLGSAEWAYEHKDFLTGKYANVASYFMPEKDGEFSQVAWNALTEMGVRQYKDVGDVYDKLVSTNATNTYYDAKEKYDADLADVTLSRNKRAIADVKAAWSETKENLYNRYPGLQSTLMLQGSQSSKQRNEQVANLQKMVNDPEAMAQIGKGSRDGILQMVSAYNDYQTQYAPLKDKRSSRSTSQKQDLAEDYHDTMTSIVNKNPDLKDVYNGVFRSLVSGGDDN